MLAKDKQKGILRDLSGEISKLADKKASILIAIDGRSASGKTTLAAYLKESLPCGVVHMDDFFLCQELRTEDRMKMPGGNIDYERFLREVMFPLQQGKEIIYRPFDCQHQTFKETVSVGRHHIILVEGAYSCHPKLWEYYDLHVFLDIESDVQKKRIRLRNGEEGLVRFQEQWIPLEESYFSFYHIKERCELNF